MPDFNHDANTSLEAPTFVLGFGRLPNIQSPPVRKKLVNENKKRAIRHIRSIIRAAFNSSG
jgi:hypothetical protein